MSRCPECGMHLPAFPEIRECPKCGSIVRISSGSRQGLMICDIAHHHETIDEALGKMRRAINSAWRQNYRGVKFIHGKGQHSSNRQTISSAVRSELLSFARQKGWITSNDLNTPGATLLWFEKG